MARAAGHHGVEATPITPHVSEVRLCDSLYCRRCETVPAPNVILVTLGEDDLRDGIGADRTETAMILNSIEADAGVDQDIALRRQHAIEVGNAPRHMDVVPEGYRVLPALSGIDDERVLR